ncbi:FCS-Like Zinc finger 8 isoform X1 [Cannabis sativa]|uniref:FCS-Like Zinc finger 8 isoform X1 n=2 Tax=Cannabis sativa TaxID=3483 RepID=UPI0029CA5202|nr:FCS-Like Zinc finger 8 isoform X1 [Cannabis sativa]
MLRKRSGVTTTATKQALMADYTAQPSPTEYYRKPILSLFRSPSLFTSFTSSKGFSETETVLSPTSILDSSKPFSNNLKNPFCSESNISNPKYPDRETKRPWDKIGSKGIGLGIVDALNNEKPGHKPSKPETRMVLFGSYLKIQIPPSSVLSPAESPKSPGDFGIKTRNSQLGSSPFGKSAIGSTNFGVETQNSNSPRVFTGSLPSSTEMELSEDYTCVITHGPNPRTTHIYDNCIVESPGGTLGFTSTKKDDHTITYPSQNFLSFCYTCKKKLGPGKDIYMYRGEKAFCSDECRYEEMMLEEGAENKHYDSV